MMFSCEIQCIDSSGKKYEVGKLSSSRMHFPIVYISITFEMHRQDAPYINVTKF